MHPVPRTPVMKVPKVDYYMMDHLRQRLSKLRDGELGTVQATLLSAAGRLTCLWLDLVDNNLLADDSAVINVHGMLNIIQCTLVLMGNANELLSQARRCNILQCVDKTLEKYGKEPRLNTWEFLFGEEFCSQFLRKLGIYLIIYLDNLKLAAPSTTQLLQDLSTVLQLFTVLGFLINYPKNIMRPTQRLEFLGFVVDTKKLRIALPPHKIEGIQKEASQLLSIGKHR